MTIVRDSSGWVARFLRTVEPDIVWTSEGPSTPGLVFSEELGRLVRAGDVFEQGTSTYRKIKEAIQSGEYREAGVLVDFFVDEASMPRGAFEHRIVELHDYLRDHGVGDDELREIDTRIFSVLRLPDGRPFKPHRLWEEIRARARELMLLCGGQDQVQALELLDELKESWRELFDRYINYLYGLYDEIARRFGEEQLADTHAPVLWAERYERYDISKVSWSETLEAHLHVAIEARRAALSGPGREGDVEIEEDEDRFTLRFDPCGSGGRTLRGEPAEGAPPVTEPPFGWAVTDSEHDFAWNKTGICYFCINCCIMQQLKPIEEFGYPVRPVEPPTSSSPNEKCVWHIYKDPTKVPDRYYEAVGRSKPDAFGSMRDK